MPHALEIRLAEAWPPDDWQNRTVLLAVSGGADSVALLRSLSAIRNPDAGRLVVAHFNHRLRGVESDADETFVRELAGQLGLSCEVGRAADPPSQGPGVAARSWDEGTARRERYEFLAATAAKVGARYVATAHTADDQAETILHRILRGTGLSGLAGIPRARPLDSGVALIRPLLTIRRAELRTYLADLRQPFRDDATNADVKFTRNRLRNDLIPRLERDYNPAVIDALLRLGNLAGEAGEIFAKQIAGYHAAVQRIGDDQIVIDCRRLAGESPFLLCEWLIFLWRERGWPEQAVGHREWTEVAGMIRLRPSSAMNLPVPPGSSTSAPSGSSTIGLSGSSTIGVLREFPGGISAQKTGEQLSLTRRL